MQGRSGEEFASVHSVSHRHHVTTFSSFEGSVGRDPGYVETEQESFSTTADTQPIVMYCFFLMLLFFCFIIHMNKYMHIC